MEGHHCALVLRAVYPNRLLPRRVGALVESIDDRVPGGGERRRLVGENFLRCPASIQALHVADNLPCVLSEADEDLENERSARRE